MRDADAERLSQYPPYRHPARQKCCVNAGAASIKQLSELRSNDKSTWSRAAAMARLPVQALEFAGLHSGRDYLTIQSGRRKWWCCPAMLPDAVVIASFIPQPLVGFPRARLHPAGTAVSGQCPHHLD